MISKIIFISNWDNKYENERIKELRVWVKEFFAENSLKQISWWTDLREPLCEKMYANDKRVENDID